MKKYLAGSILVLMLSAQICSAGPAPSRIISLAPNLTEILFELGLEKRVAAVTAYCDFPPRAAAKPKIGGMSNPSLEAVIALRPDLVLLTVDGNPPQFEKKLKRLGIRTHVFKAARISEIPECIRGLGEVLGVKIRAEAVAGRVADAVEKFRAENRSNRRGKALFIIQPEPLMAAGRGTAIDEAMAILGWSNIASRGVGPYPLISLEEIIAQSPDVIFVARAEAGMGEPSSALLQKLSALEAVRKKRVYWVGDSLFRMGPRILEGIRQMDVRFPGEK